MTRSVTVKISGLTEVFSNEEYRLLVNTPAQKFVIEPNRDEKFIDPDDRMVFDCRRDAVSWLEAKTAAAALKKLLPVENL